MSLLLIIVVLLLLFGGGGIMATIGMVEQDLAGFLVSC